MPILLIADDLLRLYSNTYKKPVAGETDDTDNYTSGNYFISTQRLVPQEVFANNWSQIRRYSGTDWGSNQVAFSSARMQPGEKLPTYVGVGAGLVSYPLLSAIGIPLIRWGIAPLSIGTFGTAAVASLLAIKPAFEFGKAVKNSIRYFSQIDYRQRHIELGGSFEDTSTSYSTRMTAISEMSSAMSHSRNWLGREALFLR